MEHVTQLPITLNEVGYLVSKRTDDKTIEKLIALMQMQFANQINKGRQNIREAWRIRGLLRQASYAGAIR
ncbi:hypothetical protein AAHB63_17245 [Bacillus thuringiensis]|uniref:Uncharacterized protein n=1 Tax=Bacillus thuringiensis YBT-1518 TaxID=529122 RepID=A0A9W3KKU8_BACTU|nr:hypothetical protein [Bacillus thuringiensis]AHA75307.1 hypothetical protein YBT1518_34861 [Bacillus thuringiensis YBT-1518]